MAKHRVAMCSPVYGGMNPMTFKCYADMIRAYTALSGVSTNFVESGSCLPQLRIKLVDEARRWEASHILWVDADMTFPSNSLERLLAHNKDVVGVNYTGRRDHMPTTYLSKGEPFWMSDHDSGVIEAYHVATGLLLTKMEVFDEITLPYFQFEPDPDMPRMLGDDEYFTQKLREAGIKLHVDAELSKECGHMGEVMFLPFEGRIAV